MMTAFITEYRLISIYSEVYSLFIHIDLPYITFFVLMLLLLHLSIMMIDLQLIFFALKLFFLSFLSTPIFVLH